MITSFKLFESTYPDLKKAWDESTENGETNFDLFFDAIGQMDVDIRNNLKSYWDTTVKGTNPNNDSNPEWRQLGDKDPYFAFIKQQGIEARR